jgi:hypothetical protein
MALLAQGNKNSLAKKKLLQKHDPPFKQRRIIYGIYYCFSGERKPC